MDLSSLNISGIIKILYQHNELVQAKVKGEAWEPRKSKPTNLSTLFLFRVQKSTHTLLFHGLNTEKRDVGTTQVKGLHGGSYRIHILKFN